MSLFQQIFSTPESNQVLLHCRRILYQLSYQGSPGALEEGMATHSSILAWRFSMDRGAWWATVPEVTESQGCFGKKWKPEENVFTLLFRLLGWFRPTLPTVGALWTHRVPWSTWHAAVVVHLLSCVRLFMTPWTLQHFRLPCPSLSPEVCSNSCPLSWWCYLTISSSVTPFSSCPQSFPASGSFPMSCAYKMHTGVHIFLLQKM